MKKILLSVAVIAIVAVGAIGATRAYFSDTETSTGNTFTAGTLDLSVDGESPWTAVGQYSTANMAPSESKDINVTLSNTGSLPAVVWAKVKVTETDTLSTQFVYSMKIATVDNVKKDWDVKVSDVNDLWIPIGRINSAGTLAVAQNFYFDEMAGNAYQGKSMTLDITFYADQVNAPGPVHTTRGLVLENKNVSTDWSPIVADGIWGIVTWDTAGVYTAKVWGMNSDTYRLTYWNELTSGPEVAIGSTQTGTNLTFTGTYTGFTTNTDAKYWVRPNTWTASSDVNSLYESNFVN